MYNLGVLNCEFNTTGTYVSAQLTQDDSPLDIATRTKIYVKIDKCELPKCYLLPKVHKIIRIKPRLISYSSHCSSHIISKTMISALKAVKDHVNKYNETPFNNSNVNYFGSFGHS